MVMARYDDDEVYLSLTQGHKYGTPSENEIHLLQSFIKTFLYGSQVYKFFVHSSIEYKVFL